MPNDANHPATNTNERDHSGRTFTISVEVSPTELEAINGWKDANGAATVPEAVRELLRLGLLSELSNAHDLVTSLRESIDG